MYQKEIIYMGLYKDGSRMGSAGFMKVENREQESRLYLKIQNLPLGINGRFPIRIYNGSDWKEIKGVSVQDGGGSWKETLPEDVNNTIIQVILSGGYMLEGKSRNAPQMTARRSVQEQKENVRYEDDAVHNNIAVQDDVDEDSAAKTQQNTVGWRDIEPPQDSRESESAAMYEDAEEHHNVEIPRNTELLQDSTEEHQDAAIQKSAMPQRDIDVIKISGKREDTTPQTIIITEELPRSTSGSTVVVPQNAPEYSLKEDKWEQILDTYEQIHPYGDDRVYVKLEPKDFVILQAQYQHLVNNSFLLHGFYNYRYIILGKEQDYYLGVPGVFYEREKMVAVMFGFEAFECPGGTVKAGEFGYYLRKVEL